MGGRVVRWVLLLAVGCGLAGCPESMPGEVLFTNCTKWPISAILEPPDPDIVPPPGEDILDGRSLQPWQTHCETVTGLGQWHSYWIRVQGDDVGRDEAVAAYEYGVTLWVERGPTHVWIVPSEGPDAFPFDVVLVGEDNPPGVYRTDKVTTRKTGAAAAYDVQ